MLRKQEENKKYWTLFLDPALKEPKHLPCLVLDSGNQFFMTDAAVKYLCAAIEEDSDVRCQVNNDKN